MKKETIKRLLLIPLSIIKSFFHSVTQVAWGLTGIIWLGIGLRYMFEKYGAESLNVINPLFLKSQDIILNNIMLFVGVFFLIYLYPELKEKENKK